MNTKHLILIALMLGLISCNDEEEKPSRKLAEMMKFTGEAHGTQGELTIDCVCDLNAELPEFEVEADGKQVYTGTLGGEIGRAVTDSDGAGIALEPFLFGDIEVHVKANDSVYLYWPGNLNTEIDFYDEIALFKGVLNADGDVNGTWWCAPFELDEGGYVDLLGRIEGTWELEEVE